MSSQDWVFLGAGSFLALVGMALLWRRMPVFRWYCSRCKRVVSASRFHPGTCTCGTNLLVRVAGELARVRTPPQL